MSKEMNELCIRYITELVDFCGYRRSNDVKSHIINMLKEDSKRIDQLSELKEIISEYDSLLDKATSGAFFSSSDYEYMDELRNRANDIIDHLI